MTLPKKCEKRLALKNEVLVTNNPKDQEFLYKNQKAISYPFEHMRDMRLHDPHRTPLYMDVFVGKNKLTNFRNCFSIQV